MKNIDISSLKKKNFWFYLAVGFILLQYWVMFDQAMGGLQVGTAGDIGSGILLSGLCWWYVWKQLNRTPYIGSLIGIFAYLIMLFIAMVVSKVYA